NRMEGLIRQRAAAGFAGRKGGGQCNQRENDHHGCDAAGTAEIAGERGGEDRCEAAADRRRDLEAERRARGAAGGGKKFRERRGLKAKPSAGAKIPPKYYARKKHPRAFS